MISYINFNGKSIINKDYLHCFSKKYIAYISKTSDIYIRTYTYSPSFLYRDVPLTKNQNP